jgi:hypothetical protein
VSANTGVTLDFIDCADRRLARCAAELVSAEAELPGVGVTVILPRRGYSPLLGRLLHDRTADKIAAVVSRIPYAAATIVPFDVRNRLQEIQERRAAADQRPPLPEPAGGVKPAGPAVAVKPAGPAEPAQAGEPASAAVGAGQVPGGQDAAGDAADIAGAELAAAEAAAADAGLAGDGSQYERPVPPPGVRPIGSLTKPGKATVEGRVYAVEIRPVERNTVLATEIADSTGHLTALFYGRSHIPGLDCGSRVRFRGQVGIRDGEAVMINPAYELVAPGTAEPPPEARSTGEHDLPPDSPLRRRGGPRRRKEP